MMMRGPREENARAEVIARSKTGSCGCNTLLLDRSTPLQPVRVEHAQLIKRSLLSSANEPFA